MSHVLDRFDLTGRVALVTGGARGLGRAIGEALAQAGAAVALTSRQRGLVDQVATDIAANTSSRTLAVIGDVSRADDVTAMVAKVLDTWGRLDILVNNAGINIRGPIDQLSEADWDAVLDTNLKGPWLCCRAVAETMKKQQGGSVINISSMMGSITMPNRTPYSSSKGGLTMLTRTLALEWAPHNIRVNAICPGLFATEINTPLLSDPKVKAEFESRVPLGRWGDPTELGPVAVFLASDAASYVTGATFFVDGGYTLQ